MSEPTHLGQLPLRPGMDVYSADHTQYLGTVTEILYRSIPEPSSLSPAVPPRVASSNPLSVWERARVRSFLRPPLSWRGALWAGRGARSEVRPPSPSADEEGGGVRAPEAGWGTSTQHLEPRTSGESLGPFPTGSVGNTGPRRQSAANAYATASDTSARDIVAFAVRPGRLGLFRSPFYVPIGAIRSLSLERIVLDRQREQIPASWHDRSGVRQEPPRS